MDVLLEGAEGGGSSNDSWTPAAPRSRPASASESESSLSSGPTWTPSPSRSAGMPPEDCDVDDNDSDFDGPPLPPPPPPPAPPGGKKKKKADHGKDKKFKKTKKDKKRRKHGGRQNLDMKRGMDKDKDGCRDKVEKKTSKRKASEDPEPPSPLDLLALEDGAASPSTSLPCAVDLSSPDSEQTVILPTDILDNLAAMLIQGFARPLEEEQDLDDCHESPLGLACIGEASSTGISSSTTCQPSDTMPLPIMPATGSPLWRLTAGFQELSIDSDPESK